MSARDGAGQQGSGRLIGALLVEAGRLRTQDLERILSLQRERGVRFGEAATALGMASAADVESALARQFGYTCLVRGASKVSESLAAAYSATGAEVESLRALRSQLKRLWFDGHPGHTSLAVVSGERKEGRSFVAASLAVVFSRLGERTLLVDADMRHPCQHGLFGVHCGAGLSAMLAGRAGHEAIQQIPDLPDLSVLPAGAAPPNSQELLGRPTFLRLLRDFAQSFSVILLDCPSAADCTDGQTIAAYSGAALVVVRRNVTRAQSARDVCDAVTQAGATVVGTVFNDF